MNSSIPRPEFKRKSIRSYVIRGSRMTDAQERAFSQHWPTYGLSLHDGLVDFSAVFSNTNPLVLEIGFGMGESLAEMARLQAEQNFIGIEVHPPGVGSLMNKAYANGSDNLKIFMADAVDVLDDCIPDNTLSRFQLFFPDPWHKKKHHKRRLVQPPFIEKILAKLTQGGIIHMATDWEEYAEQMMEVLSGFPALENLAGEYQYHDRPSYRPSSRFEQRGERLGHGCWDLLFVKK